MPKLIIHNLWAVGMHHWGPRELAVGAGYDLIEDALNPFDKNAIAVLDGPNKKAYLKRDCAVIVKFLFGLKITQKWLLKPKESPVNLNRRVGPQQRCSIGCIVRDDQKLNAALRKLKDSCFPFEIKN